jgi:hypothetical protein
MVSRKYLSKYSYFLPPGKHCDGFAYSIKLWSQETPLLGNCVVTRLDNNRGEVFSVVLAALVAKQRALNNSQK